jgi:hypothetical protein
MTDAQLHHESLSADPTEETKLLSLDEFAVATGVNIDSETSSNGTAGSGEHGHKGSRGQLHDLALFDMWVEHSKLDPLDFDPSIEGGVLYRDRVHVAFVRHPKFRKVEGTSKVSVSDIVTLNNGEKHNKSYQDLSVGIEFEFGVWDADTSDTAPFMTDEEVIGTIKAKKRSGKISNFEERLFGSDVSDDELRLTPELAVYMAELGTKPDSNPLIPALRLIRDVRTLEAIAQRTHGWSIVPISALPNRELHPEDITPDEYVQRIVKHLGERIRVFSGNGLQFHVEMLEPDAALRAANRRVQISAWLSAASSSAPFLAGSTNPNLYEHYRETHGAQEEYNHSAWHSTRFFTRDLGSPTGAVPTSPFPETAEEFFAETTEPMKKGRFITPVRLRGEHVAVRPRFDIGTYGTLEISDLDVFGGRPEKIAAHLALEKAILWKLQVLDLAGKNDLLPPELFPDVSTENFAEVRTQSIEVAKHGMAATFRNEDGTIYTAQDRYLQLLSWANEPLQLHVDGQEVKFEGLPANTVNELISSSVMLSDADFDFYADLDMYGENTEPPFDVYEKDGKAFRVTSIRGFYETGLGTVSQWLKRRAQDLATNGYSEAEQITDCMNHLGREYSVKLAEITENDIKSLAA